MPVTSASAARAVPSVRPEAKLAERFEISVPSDRAGEALSALSGLAGVALPDVKIDVSRPRIAGLFSTIEVVAQGTRDELAQLRALVKNTITTQVTDSEPSNREAARRLLAVDHPSFRPTPEPVEANLMSLRMDVLAGRYIHPEPSVWVDSHPHPMD